MNTELLGPWRRISHPFGEPLPSMDRDEWYLIWDGGMVTIEHFIAQPNRYLIQQTWPIVEASTLEAVCALALAGGYNLLRQGPERRYQI